MLFVYDSVLAEVKKEIGDHYPERGGALLGEPGQPIITRFLYDASAETTSSSYSPSRELNAQVRFAEEEEGLEFKGIIHSHPGSYDRPSPQDIFELETGLALNRHMRFYLVPIVTCEYQAGDLEEHEVALGEMKISWFAGMDSDGTVGVEKQEVSLVPYEHFCKDLESLCRSVPGLRKPEVFSIIQDGKVLLVGKVEAEERFDLLLLVDVGYPECPSRILITYFDGEQEECFLEVSEDSSFLIELEKFVLSKVEKFHSFKGGPY